MIYDDWKCTDPNDQFLGPDPEEMTVHYKIAVALIQAHKAYEDGEMTLGDLGDVYLDCGYHPHQVRQILSKCASYPIPINYFGRES